MQKSLFSKTVTLGLWIAVSACSGKPVDRPGTLQSQASDGKGAINPASTTDALSGDVDSTILGLIPDQGSSMRFLDARGLTQYYQNVFSKKDFGFMHCEKTKPLNPRDCTDSIFTSAERPAMGAFDLGSPRMNRAPQNVNPPTNLTLNYTRTLRAALSRECISLVDSEIIKFKAKDTSGNILVHADQPAPAELEEFMKRLLGLSGTAVAVPIDAEGYAEAFRAVVRAATDKNAGMRNAYVGICIALTMDPLVFIY